MCLCIRVSVVRVRACLRVCDAYAHVRACVCECYGCVKGGTCLRSVSCATDRTKDLSLPPTLSLPPFLPLSMLSSVFVECLSRQSGI